MGCDGERHGKWRFTSPTHVVRAFKQAMDELAAEGGVEARHARYCRNHDVLVKGMRSLGFKTLLKDEVQSLSSLPSFILTRSSISRNSIIS